MGGDATWTTSGGGSPDGAPYLVAGIVNVTPDSFFDGGRHAEARDAVAWGMRLAREGAHIIDVGGESTRPGADALEAGEELRRVIPVVAGLRGELEAQGLPSAISVDTYKAEVAAKALEAGATIVNDVSACRFDPALADVLAQHKPGYVLMHSLDKPADMQRDPKYADVVTDIVAFFEERMAALVSTGLPETNIALDPGVGFGKTLEHNLAILRAVERFMDLGRPIYIGLSNKSLFQGLLGLELDERGPATQIATALMASRGVRVHRVHDVAATLRTLHVVRALAPEASEGTSGSEFGSIGHA